MILLYHDNKLLNCRLLQLLVASTSYQLQIHVSVHLLTMKISYRVGENFCVGIKMISNTCNVPAAMSAGIVNVPLGFMPLKLVQIHS